ncbi:MerR family transcriptional regulator [Pseudonocardia sp. RS010]|uniref:MerR family transcriptional regulator n=1 Tax=Pseudonocardia sp. RS010 TaxID=3385979 RepID=UPI00399F4698
MLQIGEVATRVGLSLRTLRHWDEVGLVVPSARSAGGFRLYTEEDVELLLFVKSLKPLELPLDQIGDLVRLITAVRDGVFGSAADPAGREGDEAAADARDRLALYRSAVEARLEALRAQIDGLESLARELQALGVSLAPARSPIRQD